MELSRKKIQDLVLFLNMSLILLMALVSSTNFVNAEPINIIETIEVGSLAADREERILDIDINPNTNMIYVLFHDGDKVAVLDSSTNELVGHIQVGGERLVVDPNSNVVYVLHGTFRYVAAIDGSTNNLVAYLPHIAGTGCIDNCGVDVFQVAGAGDLTVSEDSSIYLVKPRDNSTLIVNDGQQYSSQELPSHIGGDFSLVVSNLETNMIYYTNPGANQVYAVDGNTYEVKAKILLGISPEAIAVNPETNMIYVVGGGSMSVIDGKTHKTLPNSVTLYSYQETSMVATNPTTNKIYVAGQTRLSIIDGETNSLEQTINLGDYNGYSFKGIVVNPNSNMVYLADWEHRLIAINADLISDFKLSLTEGTLGPISIDPVAKSMKIGMDATGEGEMSITLPRELIDAKTAAGDSDEKFTIRPVFDRPDTSGTDELQYNEISTTDTHRELKIQVPPGATGVEIIGTQVVPEFPISTLILAAAIASIILVSARLSKGKSILFFGNK